MNYLRYPRGLYIAFYAWAKYIQSLRLWRLKTPRTRPFCGTWSHSRYYREEHEVIWGIIAILRSRDACDFSARSGINAWLNSVEEDDDDFIKYTVCTLNISFTRIVPSIICTFSLQEIPWIVAGIANIGDRNFWGGMVWIENFFGNTGTRPGVNGNA